MSTWIKGKFSTIKKLAGLTNKKIKKAFMLTYYDGHKNGYYENDITVNFYKDGCMSIYEDEDDSFVFLYKPQVENLKLLLEGENPNATGNKNQNKKLQT